MVGKNVISVRGAREHNLKNISVDLPRNELIVITGLSGSGKSSLAFDTIYAEGQRRYIESLSAYARQFLNVMQKPAVDSIEGLSPAISIDQKTTTKSPRSTVGTVTEIYDYMRLLWARVGIPYSPTTGEPIASQTIPQMVDAVIQNEEGTRILILAPIVKERKGEHRALVSDLKRKGFERVRVNGNIIRIDDMPKLDRNSKHSIDVVVDRIVIEKSDEAMQKQLQLRLSADFETALSLSHGIAVSFNTHTEQAVLFSEHFACPVSGFTIPEIEPRLFSFNSPIGACEGCDGLGVVRQFDPELIIPDSRKSIVGGAILPWSQTGSIARTYRQTLSAVGKHLGFTLDVPWEDLAPEHQQTILFGTKAKISYVYETATSQYKTSRGFEGVIPNLKRRVRETYSHAIREDLSKYQRVVNCQACAGQRLNPQALSVKLAGKPISALGDLSLVAALKWFSRLNRTLSKRDREIAKRILKEITDRLGFLVNVGLPYLTLGRSSGSLSGGESQRIRLASQIGSQLTGVLYVLDEPSIGLHQRDNARLLHMLMQLRDLGNTVIVVEHDEDAIRQADFIVDMGPHAGRHGGHVVAAGKLAQILKTPESITAQYLRADQEVPLNKRREISPKTPSLRLHGAAHHNLREVSVRFPLGRFICVTGVSGSGKSSLVIETLQAELARRLMGAIVTPGPFSSIEGVEFLDKVIVIDQSPIGRTPRSNAATYTGAFTPIREWFAALPESNVRGYAAGRFSFNVKGGRCESCEGDGVIKIEMHFLPDVYVVCEACKGKRYNRDTLEVKYRNKTIADILAMSVDDGRTFFAAIPNIRDKLKTLCEVGLGYLQIGQAATTLSGGEAQRIKLSKELSRRSTGRTIYILDEPTTGLHFDDVAKLVRVLHRLVESGNTVVVIEHNLDVIKTADWIIDVGPDGGDAGGKIIAQGTPEDVTKVRASYTGQHLAPLLARHAQRAQPRSRRSAASATAAASAPVARRKVSRG